MTAGTVGAAPPGICAATRTASEPAASAVPKAVHHYVRIISPNSVPDTISHPTFAMVVGIRAIVRWRKGLIRQPMRRRNMKRYDLRPGKAFRSLKKKSEGLTASSAPFS